MISIRKTCSGEIRMIVRNPDGTVDQDTGWTPNTVLDNGLVNMTTQSSWATWFHIGSSNTPPTPTQTQLIAYLASSNTGVGGDQEVNNGAPNYEGVTTRGRRFQPGLAPRTVREFGVSGTDGNGNLSIRGLVTPEVSQSEVQILDVYWRFTNSMNLDDVTGTTSIFGETYNYTVRIGTVDDLVRTMDAYRPDLQADRHKAYTGDIGGITGQPAGTDADATSVTIDVQASGVCTYKVFFDIDAGNIGGIRSIASRVNGGAFTGTDPRIQVEFRRQGDDAPIPKDETREITFDLSILWSRP